MERAFRRYEAVHYNNSVGISYTELSEEERKFVEDEFRQALEMYARQFNSIRA